LKLDTQKPGLCALFLPYKAVMLKHLYEVTKTDSLAGKGSGYLWKWLQKNAKRLGVTTMSRASVVNALNDLVDEGLLKFKEVTGKGGIRRLYSVAMTPREFEDHFLNEFIATLHTIFQGDWWKLEAEGL